MTHLDGFILRSEAQEKYERSKSSFIRDIDRAFRKEDFDFLSHFKVVLRDGTIIEGRDATKAKLQELSSDNPEWFIEESLLERGYWKKTRGKAGRRQEKATTDETQAAPRSDGRLPPNREELLLAQIEELRRDKEVQRQQLERTDNTLNKTSELMSQLHVLLREMQDRLLPAPSQARRDDRSAEVREQAIHTEVNEVVRPDVSTKTTEPTSTSNTTPTNNRKGESRRWWQREIRIPFLPYE